MVEVSAVVADLDADVFDDGSFDEIEAALLHEDVGPAAFGGKASGNFNSSGASLGKRVNLSSRVQNDIRRSEKKGEKRTNFQGRDDRATSEQVLDPRTRLILFKLLSNGFLDEIDGCLSTGKEANVYYARGGNGKEYAVKIFKTSILVFKDRDKYVSGEYRFRNGYCKSNPRKMVRTWAEKEMRNLKRIHNIGVPVPTPHLLKSHVLVMDFLGKDGWCAVRLKDAKLSLDQREDCYRTVCVDVRRMYQECNLVHGDLSEYNILWHQMEEEETQHDEGGGGLEDKNNIVVYRPVIIDVSQSVEQSHPFASEFLRKDIANITEFFMKGGVQVLPAQELYNYVTEKELRLPTRAAAAAAVGAATVYSSAVDRNGPNSALNAKLLSAHVRALRDSLEYRLERSEELHDQELTEHARELLTQQQHQQQKQKQQQQIKRSRSATHVDSADVDGMELLGGELDEAAAIEAAESVIAHRHTVNESVFMQTHIPVSLSEISNPQAELDRIQRGQRESVFQAAVEKMLAVSQTQTHSAQQQQQTRRKESKVRSDKGKERNGEEVDDSYEEEKDDSAPQLVVVAPSEDIDAQVSAIAAAAAAVRAAKAAAAAAASAAEAAGDPASAAGSPSLSGDHFLSGVESEPESSSIDSDSVEEEEEEEEEEDSGSDSEDDYDSEEDEERALARLLERQQLRAEKKSLPKKVLVDANGDKRYRKQLPGHDNPDERLKEKEARKLAKKSLKADRAEKRANKMPKHVKKRATKAKVGKKSK